MRPELAYGCRSVQCCCSVPKACFTVTFEPSWLLHPYMIGWDAKASPNCYSRQLPALTTLFTMNENAAELSRVRGRPEPKDETTTI